MGFAKEQSIEASLSEPYSTVRSNSQLLNGMAPANHIQAAASWLATTAQATKSQLRIS